MTTADKTAQICIRRALQNKHNINLRTSFFKISNEVRATLGFKVKRNETLLNAKKIMLLHVTRGSLYLTVT